MGLNGPRDTAALCVSDGHIERADGTGSRERGAASKSAEVPHP